VPASPAPLAQERRSGAPSRGGGDWSGLDSVQLGYGLGDRYETSPGSELPAIRLTIEPEAIGTGEIAPRCQNDTVFKHDVHSDGIFVACVKVGRLNVEIVWAGGLTRYALPVLYVRPDFDNCEFHLRFPS
jgi:hypothetical protein